VRTAIPFVAAHLLLCCTCCTPDAGRARLGQRSVDIVPLSSSERVAAEPPASAPAEPGPPPVGGASLPPSPKGDAPRVEFVTRKTKGTYDAYVAYPKLSYPDAALSRALNARVQRLVERREREFRELGRHEGLSGVDYPGPHSFFAMACSVPYASRSLASIGCDIYEFAGGAHGSKGYVALNLALPKVREIGSSQVLHGDGAASELLVRLCNEALVKAGQEDEVNTLVGPSRASDTRPLTRFTTFTIEHDGLTFYFKDQLPHVGADAVVPHVTWAALTPALREGVPATLVDPGAAFVSADAPLSPWGAREEEEEERAPRL
jgi:hypothetical protein